MDITNAVVTLDTFAAHEETCCGSCNKGLEWVVRDYDTWTTHCCGYLYVAKVLKVRVDRDPIGL